MLRPKGLIVQKHYATAVTRAAHLKRIIGRKTAIPKTEFSVHDVGISFFSFFYFGLFVFNSERWKKCQTGAKQGGRTASFWDVNYGSGEVRVSLFFLVVACVLVLEVKSWKNYIFYEKWWLVLIFGWVLRENYGLHLIFCDFHIKISIHVIIDFTFINLLQLKNL